MEHLFLGYCTEVHLRLLQNLSLSLSLSVQPHPFLFQVYLSLALSLSSQPAFVCFSYGFSYGYTTQLTLRVQSPAKSYQRL